MAPRCAKSFAVLRARPQEPGWLTVADLGRHLSSVRISRTGWRRNVYAQLTGQTGRILAARDARSTASLRHFAAWCGIRA